MNAVAEIGLAPALYLSPADVEACVRHLRAFLDPLRIRGLQDEFARLDADGNWCRTLLRNEEVPWLRAFDELDRCTMRGMRRLPVAAMRDELLTAAWVGLVLRAIESGFPPKMRDQMAAKLLDFRANRGTSVLMEWSAALFYQRRGFHLDWNQGAGFEFRADGQGLSFEVECKRIYRKVKERLDLRGVATISHGLHEALGQAGWHGEVFCDTPLTQVPAGLDVLAAVRAALPGAPPAAGLDILVPEIGRVVGSVHPIPTKLQNGLWREVANRIKAKPHDYRGCVGPVPSKADRRGAVLAWVRGPRITEQEHIQEVRARLEEGAAQLTGTVPGLIFAEHQDVKDPHDYLGAPMFRDAAEAAFALNPAVAAVIWRTDQAAVWTGSGFGLRQELVVMRNAACPFPDVDRIPLFDLR